MRWIKIVDAPSGPAPLAIREAWIGCCLPVLEGPYAGQRRWLVQMGVFPEQKRSWLTCLLTLRFIQGYPVSVRDSLILLDTHAPTAARWWQKNVSSLFAEDGIFIFDAAACEVVPDKAPSIP